MDDSTRILDAGTADYPLDAGMAASDESCPHCASTIRAGSQFCPSCGYQRGTWAAAATQAAPQAAAEELDRGPALFELVDGSGTCYGLPAGETVLGRGEVDLQIEDGYLSRRHALFVASDAGLSMSDLGSANGSFVGDLKLDRETPHPLEDGQTIRLGQMELTVHRLDAAGDATQLVTAVDSAAPQEAASEEIQAPLEEVSSEDAGQERVASRWQLENDSHGSISIPLGELTMGRSASKSDLQVSGDGYVSGLHGKLIATDDSLSFMDLGSTNGSRINDEALAANEATALNAGDRLQLGQTTFIVSLTTDEDDAPAADDDPGDTAQ